MIKKLEVYLLKRRIKKLEKQIALEKDTIILNALNVCLKSYKSTLIFIS